MEILGIGIQEVLLILALIVVVVGPRRLPEMAYYLGRGVKKLQRYARVVRDEFSEEFAYLNEEMEAVRADVQEMRTTVREVQEEVAEVAGEVEEVTSEAVDELGEVKAGVEQAGSGASPEQPSQPDAASFPPIPEPVTVRNGAAAGADVNGAAAPRGVAGPANAPSIATALARPVSPRAETSDEADGGDEVEAKPEKPLVF